MSEHVPLLDVLPLRHFRVLVTVIDGIGVQPLRLVEHKHRVRVTETVRVVSKPDPTIGYSKNRCPYRELQIPTLIYPPILRRVLYRSRPTKHYVSFLNVTRKSSITPT